MPQRFRCSMYSIWVKLLSYNLTLYIASLIIFKINYINTPHIINLLLLLNFFFVIFITKEYIYRANSMIGSYALFTVFTLGSAFWGIGFEIPFFRSMQLFVILLNLFVIYNIITKFSLYSAFLNGILLGSFVNYILILGVVSAPFPIIDHLGHRYFGTLGNPNLLSMFMITSIVSSIIYLRREQELSRPFYYYQYINILLSTYIIFLTVSKKGIFSGLLLLTVFLLLTMKKPKHFLKLIFFSGIGIASLFYFVNLETLLAFADRIIYRFTKATSTLSSQTQFGSTGERRYFIELGWNYFMQNPLFGYGIDNFRLVARTYSHNNYIELLFSVGLIGTTLFYSIYYYLLKKIKAIKENYLKIIFFTYIFILLVADLAQVSYGNKFTLYILVFLSAFAETNSTQNQKIT